MKMTQAFIIEEFNFYKVFLYGKDEDHIEADYGIQIDIPSGHVNLIFVHELSGLKNTCTPKKGGKYVFNVYLNSRKFSNFIDILRNEEPLFFYYNFTNNNSYITTTTEPVGEHEKSS